MDDVIVFISAIAVILVINVLVAWFADAWIEKLFSLAYLIPPIKRAVDEYRSKLFFDALGRGEISVSVGGHYDAESGEYHGLTFNCKKPEPTLTWNEKCPECIAHRAACAGREYDPFAATREDQPTTPETHAETQEPVTAPVQELPAAQETINQ